MLRIAALLLFITGPAVPGLAQTDSSAPPDTLALEPFRYGQSRFYSDILSESVELQLVAPLRVDTLASGDPMLGIRGLVVDETLTPSGRLFYETYFLRWEPPPGGEAVTIEIGERPLPGNGTAVVITADGEIVVQARLPRRSEEVEDLAAQAVSFVRGRIGG